MSKSAEIKRLSCPVRNVYQGPALRVLFVCSMGMLRSATMQAMAAARGLNARACGMEADALIPITETLVEWADLVVFASPEHQAEALRRFPVAAIKAAPCWDVPDCYEFREAGLMRALETRINNLPRTSLHFLRSTEGLEGEIHAG